jgi:hypothetical protein
MKKAARTTCGWWLDMAGSRSVRMSALMATVG